MSNVEHLFDLSIHRDLLQTLEQIIDWQEYNQICINTVPGQEDNHQFGEGYLAYAWNNISELPMTPPVEADFTEVCTIFKGTVFEELLNELKQKFKIGRVRIMKSMPGTCLTWHSDDTVRVHYPMKTQEGCYMVFEDEVVHLDQNSWVKTFTKIPHTAMNASEDVRIHLVACILE